MLTELRDADVTSLTGSIQSYNDSVIDCSGPELLSNVENIMLELGDCAMSSDEFKTVAEAFEVCKKSSKQQKQLEVNWLFGGLNVPARLTVFSVSCTR